MRCLSIRCLAMMGWISGVLWLGGCGGPAGSEVEGIVKLDGKPLEGATVVFHPKSEGGTPASGVTDAEGKFKLSTNQGFKIPHGMYKVAITKQEKLNVPAASGGDSGGDVTKNYLAMMQKNKDGKYQLKEAKKLTPPQYADPATTPLEAQVPSANYEFDLKSGGK